MEAASFRDALLWWEGTSGCFSAARSGCSATVLGFCSVVLLLLSRLLLLGHMCQSRACTAGSTVACGLYCLIGDLCDAVGSFLSHQLPLQIIVGFLSSTLDLLLLISVCLPFCWWHHSRTGKRVRMLSRRRRQNSLAVCLLFGMGGCVYLGSVLQPRQLVAIPSPTSRRLLGTFQHGPIELLGYVLGLLSFAISWTSRFPVLLKARRGEMNNPLVVTSRVLSFSTCALYASALLLQDARFESIITALPWILSGVCCAFLDFIILMVSCYRKRYKCRSVRPLDADAVSLLGASRRPASAQHRSKVKPARKSPASKRSSSPKRTEMGRYMDISLQPVRKVCLKEVTITREGSSDTQPLKRTVKVVRVDECYSSGSTTDSSSISSELEWDFGETVLPWSSRSGAQQSADVFPPKDWTADHSSKCNSPVVSNPRAVDRTRSRGSWDTGLRPGGWGPLP